MDATCFIGLGFNYQDLKVKDLNAKDIKRWAGFLLQITLKVIFRILDYIILNLLISLLTSCISTHIKIYAVKLFQQKQREEEKNTSQKVR